MVSLSVGNSCKFLCIFLLYFFFSFSLFYYFFFLITNKDKNFQNQIREVVLESGDALVFGGKSRLVAHTVSEIIPLTSPVPVLSNLRLNLTFREHTKNRTLP